MERTGIPEQHPQPGALVSSPGETYSRNSVWPELIHLEAGTQVTTSQMGTDGQQPLSSPFGSSWGTLASVLPHLLGSEARRQLGSWPPLLVSWSPPPHQTAHLLYLCVKLMYHSEGDR